MIWNQWVIMRSRNSDNYFLTSSAGEENNRRIICVHESAIWISVHMSQLRAGGLVIPGLTSSGQGQTRSEHAPGCYGNPVYYSDEYYFYFMGGHA